MYVYILSITEYSSSDIIGVYDSLEKAKKKLDKLIYKRIIGVCIENQLESLYKTKKNCIKKLYDKTIIYIKDNYNNDIYDSDEDNDEDNDSDSEDSDSEDNDDDEKYIEKILRLKISIVKKLLKGIITIDNYKDYFNTQTSEYYSEYEDIELTIFEKKVE